MEYAKENRLSSNSTDSNSSEIALLETPRLLSRRQSSRSKTSMISWPTGTRRLSTLSSIDHMPVEILVHIFQFLSYTDRAECAKVSRLWYHVAMDGILWQQFCVSQFQRNIDSSVIESVSSRASTFLQVVNLEGCRHVVDGDIVSLTHVCRRIRRLSVRGCHLLTRTALEAVTLHCPQLTHLSFAKCHRLTDCVPSIALGCPLLQSVDFSFCPKVSSSLIENVVCSPDHEQTTPSTTFSQLHTLKVSHCQRISDRALTALGQHCPLLHTLNLQMCRRVTDTGLSALFPLISTLRIVNLSHLKRITNQSVAHLIQQSPRLRSLRLSNCALLSDSLFSLLHSSFPRLSHPSLSFLSLSDYPSLSDRSIALFPQLFPSLRSLALSSCDSLSDSALSALIASPQLNSQWHTLSLDGCINLSDSSLSVISQHANNLKKLDIFDCRLISQSAVDLLKRNFGSKLKLRSFVIPLPERVNHDPNPNQNGPNRNLVRHCTIL